MPAISMDYFLARRAGKQTRSSFEGGMDLFANHQFSFATGGSATAHKLHHPQRNYAICFECQQHQRIDHLPVLYIARRKMGNGS
jgi:hypothetical protein